MTRRIAGYGGAVAAILVVAWLVSTAWSPSAQQAGGDEGGEAVATPRMPDGKPDLSGRWGGGGGGGGRPRQEDPRATSRWSGATARTTRPTANATRA